MRTTVDIPDPIYRELKSKAALEGRSVKEVILRHVTRQAANDGTAGTTKLPAIKSKNPGSLKLEDIYLLQPGVILLNASTAVAVGKTGKSSDPDFEPVKVYIRKLTHKVARRKWEDEVRGDFSDLMEFLLQQYLESRDSSS